MTDLNDLAARVEALDGPDKAIKEIPESWFHYEETGKIPRFTGIGKYPKYDRHWNRIGFSDTQQYSGQKPVRYPLDWDHAMCFLAKGAEYDD